MGFSKNKALFVDISEFSVLAAVANGFRNPIQIEQVAELPLDGNQDIGAFFRSLVDLKGGNFIVARCGVYPEGRFIHYHEFGPGAKMKDPNVVAELLKNQFEVDPQINSIAVLDARTGADFQFGGNPSRRVLIAGAGIATLRRTQEELLGWGLYPERMELSTLTTIGGISDYTRFSQLNSPTVCLELTSKAANIFVLNRGAVEVSRSVAVGLDSICPLLQRELALKDEGSARKLFFSNTFDFAEMGPKLLRRIIKELQASIGFYEVHTGLTVEKLFVGVLPKNLGWISKTVSEALDVEIVKPNFGPWLEGMGVNVSESVDIANLGSRWLGLFSLMGDFQLREQHHSEQKEERLSA